NWISCSLSRACALPGPGQAVASTKVSNAIHFMGTPDGSSSKPRQQEPCPMGREKPAVAGILHQDCLFGSLFGWCILLALLRFFLLFLLLRSLIFVLRAGGFVIDGFLFHEVLQACTAPRRSG